jgi:hypothetical protein
MQPLAATFATKAWLPNQQEPTTGMLILVYMNASNLLLHSHSIQTNLIPQLVNIFATEI